MKRIIKFALEPALNVLARPYLLEPVHMAFQRGTLTAWFEESMDIPVDSPQQFYVAVTGEQLFNDWEYVATAMTEDQDFVCHLFVRT